MSRETKAGYAFVWESDDVVEDARGEPRGCSRDARYGPGTRPGGDDELPRIVGPITQGKSATLTDRWERRTEATSMWGAVIGDIAGSRFEGSRGGPKDFELFHRRCTFTDDTVCTGAIAHIIVADRNPAFTLQRWCRRHPDRGYGGAFRLWIETPVPRPYGSFGNGAAMRVSPVALLYRRRALEEALAASDRVTEITHDHPAGLKGARAVTEAIWLALRGEEAEAVRREIANRYGYDLERSVEDIRPSHRFDVTCQGTVPTALICALESTSLEDAVRNTVSLGGDADTLAAIAGAVGEALHGLPEGLVETARERYLQVAEDITGALDALYEQTMAMGMRFSREPSPPISHQRNGPGQ